MSPIFNNQEYSPVKWLRSRKKNPCPVCGRTSWCEISYDGRLAHCMHSPSDKPMRWRGGGWIHELYPLIPPKSAGPAPTSPASPTTPGFPASPTSPAPGTEPSPGGASPGGASPEGASPPDFVPLPAETLDEVFQAFLAFCSLKPGHRAYLAGEGVPAGLCGSLDYAAAATIARKLVGRFGREIAARHPLFRLATTADGSRSWWTIAAADGLLFPAMNHQGLITGIQIRKDKPLGKDDRYRWLSSEGKGGTPLSVFWAGGLAGRADLLVVTEGFKKAAAVAEAWECHALSLAGVTAYRAAELVASVETLQVDRIALALDQDKRTRPQVQEAERRLVNLLAAAFPNLELYCLEWDGAKKGLDDALKAKLEFNFVPAGPGSGPRLVTHLPPEMLPRHFSPPEPGYSLEEARPGHRRLFNRLLAAPDGSQTVVTSVTGTGKSQAADDELARAVLEGRLQPRVLVMAPDKANIEERTGPDSLLGKAVRRGLVAIQRGRRLVDLTEPYTPSPEDCANPEAFAAGAARHPAARVVCAGCPFASPENWQKISPGQPRPFKCEAEGYLASRKRSDAARAVLATKEAYLNNSEKLAGFDLVICDEDLLPYLYEQVKINSGVMSGWREKIALKQLQAPGWLELFQILEKALDRFSRHFSLSPGAGADPDRVTAGRLYPARPALAEAARSLGLELEKVVESCARPVFYQADRDETYPFERPYRHNGQLVLPYRAAAALVKALQDPLNSPYISGNFRGSFSLEIFEVRGHLIEILREKTLLVLDATLPPVLQIPFPDLQEVHYEVAQHLEITQVTNALYRKQDLYNPATRESLVETIRHFTRDSRKPLAILPLRFEEGPDKLALPAGIQVEHWGRHKATSKFARCDSLVLLGHHLRPVDYIRAEVTALRAFCGPTPPRPLPAPASPGLPPEAARQPRLRLYNCATGSRALGRWLKTDPDPEVQAAIEHDYASHIIQAVGRLRGALRPAHLPPARVLILCNEPVANLKIDCLTTTRRITQSGLAAEALALAALQTALNPTSPAGANSLPPAGLFTRGLNPVETAGGTNPPEKGLFISNIYMKQAENGGPVLPGLSNRPGRPETPPPLPDGPPERPDNLALEYWPLEIPPGALNWEKVPPAWAGEVAPEEWDETAGQDETLESQYFGYGPPDLEDEEGDIEGDMEGDMEEDMEEDIEGDMEGEENGKGRRI